MEVQCLSCKRKTEQKDSVIRVNKRGLRMTCGVCSVCGRKTFQILKKE